MSGGGAPTVTRDLLERLRSVLGDAAVEQNGVITPRSTSDVVAACTLCSDTGTPITITSGLAVPQEGDVAITMRALNGAQVVEGSMVAFAGAGALLAQLHSAVARAGLALAVPLRDDVATHVGSLIATGAVVRRSLTGIVAVLPTGERVATQGHVHKDVAGYDLAGVLIGSQGRLAAITGAYFRLVPRGAVVPHAEVAGPMGEGPGVSLLRLAFDPHGLLTPAAH